MSSGCHGKMSDENTLLQHPTEFADPEERGVRGVSCGVERLRGLEKESEKRSGVLLLGPGSPPPAPALLHTSCLTGLPNLCYLSGQIHFLPLGTLQDAPRGRPRGRPDALSSSPDLRGARFSPTRPPGAQIFPPGGSRGLQNGIPKP